MNKDELKDYLYIIISGIISDKEALEVEVVQDSMGVKFTVKVAREDMGKIIGKQGAVAQAIRTILRSAGFSSDIRASMVIYDPNKPDFVPRAEKTDKEMLNG